LIKKMFRRKIWVRTLVQLIFLLLIALIAVNHRLAESGGGIAFLSSASLHALCPFGGVVSIYRYATTGRFVQKIHESSFILMNLAFFLAVLFGPVFCGWVCPLGTVQEWFGKLGKKFFKRRYNRFITTRLDKPLRYVRYFVLAWVVYVTATSATLFFVAYDPYYALFNFWSGEVAWTAFAILGLTLASSLFVERPWCKYACPYGAVLGVFNLFRIFRIRRSEALCKFDLSCDQACPMNIPVSSLKVVRDHQCISCLECTTEASCPAAGVVEFVAGGR
jgi:polyferredoxin